MQDMLRLGRRSRVWSFLLDVGSATEKLGEGGERQAPPEKLMGTATLKLASDVILVGWNFSAVGNGGETFLAASQRCDWSGHRKWWAI